MKNVLTIALFALTAGAASAQDADIGKQLYENYCSGCHGVNADGKGPVAEYLTIAPPALTGLAKAQSDGQFPMLKVIHVIDGRTGMRTHEGPMPVFGEAFQEEMAQTYGKWGSVVETRGRIMSIALYLESIQD